jgi:hypothetical protein
MGINMTKKKQENKNNLSGRLEGSRIAKRWFWACLSEKSKKGGKVFVGWKVWHYDKKKKQLL